MNFSMASRAVPVIGPVVSPLLIIWRNGSKRSDGSKSLKSNEYNGFR